MYAPRDDDDDDDDDDTAAAADTSYRGYSSYAAWCTATNCTVESGVPEWNTDEGALSYSVNRAFFPGSVISSSSFTLGVTTANPSYYPEFQMISGSLPPGLRFDYEYGYGYIEGTITDAVELDTLTFDGETDTFNLTSTSSPVTLNTITFNGDQNYEITRNTPSTDTLENVTFTSGYAGPYDLDQSGSPGSAYSDATDESKLEVKDMYGVVIPSSHYSIVTNADGDPAIQFMTPAYATSYGHTTEITYETLAPTAYDPSDYENLTIVVDGETLVEGDGNDFIISGTQVQFSAAKSAPASTTLDTITFENGVSTYDLIKTNSTTTLDTIAFPTRTTETLNTISFPATPSAGPYNPVSYTHLTLPTNREV